MKINTHDKEVLKAVDDREEGVTVAGITEKTGIPAPIVREALRRLENVREIAYKREGGKRLFIPRRKLLLPRKDAALPMLDDNFPDFGTVGTEARA